MITSISMAPIEDNEEPMTDEHTNDLPEVVTNGLLFADVTGIPLDESIKTDGRLLFDKSNVIPRTPKPDEARAVMIPTPSPMGDEI